MALTAAAVSAVAHEESVMKLLEEWLRGWFDGASHTLGGHGSIAFPAATLRFQQSALPQPLAGVGITAVWISGRHQQKWWEKNQHTAWNEAAWLFLVRTDATNAAGNADAQCRKVSDLLFALLGNAAATRALAQKGIHKVCPGSPQLMSDGKSQDKHDPNYITRLVPCTAHLRYQILLS